jgi:hypothetical protein|tara:strand:- start:100066 stop:100851 length:786 start_codon:yes stop_codon:yes gene_type:complete
MSTVIAERLRVLAGRKKTTKKKTTKKKAPAKKTKSTKKTTSKKKSPAKKKTTKKRSTKPRGNYSTDAENLYDQIMQHVVDKTSYTQNDRVMRLLIRLKQAMQAEGFSFKGGPTKVKPSSNTVTGPRANVGEHVLCDGGDCLLLATRPPTGLDAEAVMDLAKMVKAKSAYKFSVCPADASSKRRSGKNTALPKPCTWYQLESYGLTVEAVQGNDGRTLMEKFRLDGVDAYTFDRTTFFCSKAATCRRWVEGLEQAIRRCLDK